MKKILYIDMDGVIADFKKRFSEHFPNTELRDEDNIDDYVLKGARRIFSELDIYGDHDLVKKLFTLFCKVYDVYVLSTPMWTLPESYMDKRIWLEQQFREDIYKRLILTHNKGLLIGDYLIDDRIKNGVAGFRGEHIHFGKDPFHDMIDVAIYLATKDGWLDVLFQEIPEIEPPMQRLIRLAKSTGSLFPSTEDDLKNL